MVRIALIGDYDPTSANHAATEAALRHAFDRLRIEGASAWIGTETIDEAVLGEASALLIAPGSPYKDAEKVFAAIRFARENRLPCLGTCGGFQHMVIEYARNVLSPADPSSADAIIQPLSCSLLGRSMALTFVADSHVATHYGSTSAPEQYYCSMGVDPARVAELKSGPLRVTGQDSEGEVRVIELPEHPFFIGTLFVPQVRSLPGRPHPLVAAFVRAAAAFEKARTRA